MEINATIIGQAITFAILVLFTMKFVWPPLNNMMERRANQIADGLAAAAKGQRELLDAEARVTEELHRGQLRASEIIANAEKRADQIIDEAKNGAIKEGEKILADAKSQINQEFARVKEQLRQQVALLALKGAEQILKAEIDIQRHEKLLTSIKTEL